MTRVFASIALALALVATPAAVSAGTPFPEFLAHVSEAAPEAGALGESMDFDALIDWAEDEIVYLLENTPDECYAGLWGRWLLAVSYMQATGVAGSALETLTMLAMTAALTDVSEDFGPVADEAVLACS